MRVSKETVYAVEMSETEARRVERTVSRVMGTLEKLPVETYGWLVTLGDVDQLLALRTALRNEFEKKGSA